MKANRYPEVRFYGIGETTEVCANCKYFVQHYVYTSWEGTFSPCYVGHCIKPRLKSRKVTDICDRFALRGNEMEDKTND